MTDTTRTTEPLTTEPLTTEHSDTVKRFGSEKAHHQHHKVQAWTRATVRAEPNTTSHQESFMDKPATGYFDHVAVCRTRCAGPGGRAPR